MVRKAAKLTELDGVSFGKIRAFPRWCGEQRRHRCRFEIIRYEYMYAYAQRRRDQHCSYKYCIMAGVDARRDSIQADQLHEASHGLATEEAGQLLQQLTAESTSSVPVATSYCTCTCIRRMYFATKLTAARNRICASRCLLAENIRQLPQAIRAWPVVCPAVPRVRRLFTGSRCGPDLGRVQISLRRGRFSRFGVGGDKLRVDAVR